MDIKFGVPELDQQAPRGENVVGKMKVIVRDESTADVHLTLDAAKSSGAVASAVAGREPVVYTELIRNDGSLIGSPDPLVGSMLSPPMKALRPGEQTTEPIAIPVNANGSALKARGERSFTHRGFVKCGASTCAHFSYRVWVPEVEVPAGLDAAMDYQVLVRGFSLFNVEDGTLYWHRSATRLHLGSGSGDASGSEPGHMMRQQHLHDLRALAD